MLAKCSNLNFETSELKEIEAVIRSELEARPIPPSLIHGDLWGGNGAFADGEPVIYDPATYYGDREADLAMTELFGGYGGDFYQVSKPRNCVHDRVRFLTHRFARRITRATRRCGRSKRAMNVGRSSTTGTTSRTTTFSSVAVTCSRRGTCCRRSRPSRNEAI